MLSAFLIDDEKLALGRLQRMLNETSRVRVVGVSSDPVAAVQEIEAAQPDVLFLDIHMPGMTGFELAGALAKRQPLIVFTTAYDQYALKAFEVNSIDYLLKPIEAQQLERALNKLENIRRGAEPPPAVEDLVRRISTALGTKTPDYPRRLASRLGERVQFIELSRVTHVFAKDKLTYAATEGKNYCIDATIAELEQRLDPGKFVRVHRSTIVNLDFVQELYQWFAGRMLLRLKDANQSELTVSRDRVKALRDRLGV